MRLYDEAMTSIKFIGLTLLVSSGIDMVILVRDRSIGVLDLFRHAPIDTALFLQGVIVLCSAFIAWLIRAHYRDFIAGRASARTAAGPSSSDAASSHPPTASG